MQKVIEFIKKWETRIKFVFFVSVLILVVSELIRLSKTISISDIEQNFNQLSPFAIVVMMVIGLVTVVPMLLYDIVLNKEINSDYSLKYILETSWIINTFNNLIGFAGIVDIGLRYSFYAKDENTEQSMQGISRVIPYFMTGFSLCSLIALCLVLLTPGHYNLLQYWPLLAVIFLYLPVILFVSVQKKFTYFGSMKFSYILALIISSFLDWIGVIAGFVAIGCLMGMKVPILNVAVLIIIAHAIGMLSMIPGGLGSFDLMMITGLTSIGIQNSQVVAWILLFRLFYYIIPFLLGVVFFVKNISSKINEKYLGIPEKLIKTGLENCEIFCLRLFGFFMILSALIPDDVSHLPLIGRLDPIQAELVWQFPSILIGGLFFILARLVKNRLHFAIVLTYWLFLITIIYINLAGFSIPTSIFLALLFVMMISIRKQLNRQAFTYSWEGFTKDMMFLASTFVILFIVEAPHQIRPIKNIQHININHYIVTWLHILLLAVVAFSVFGFVIFLASRKRQSIGEPFEIERFDRLLNQYHCDNSEAGLAYLGDKLLYWYQVDQQDKMVFQFTIKNNKCIVMSDPMGDQSVVRKATTAFLKEARSQNMSVVFYEIRQSTTLLLHEFGYDFIKFGESAKVKLKTFSTEGHQGKKYRVVLNRFHKLNYSFAILKPPHSQVLLDELEKVSLNWLNGRKEKGFSLGFFNRDYLQLAPIAVVKDETGKILAFANFLPTNNTELATVDLMRYELDETPNGIMDYLFINLFLHFKEQGVTYFDLGMAPLANVGNMENSFIQEKIAYLIYSLSTKFYSFGGLRKYKQKFSPQWHSKYIAYPKKNWLLYDMITLYFIDGKKIK